VIVSLALKPGGSIGRALRRTARKQLGKASTRLLKNDRNDEDVHEGRKSVKKVEAVATLFDQLGVSVREKDMHRLHTAKRALSSIRDADAALETLGRLRSRFSHLIPTRISAAIRRRLERRRSSMTPSMQSGSGSLVRAGKTLGKLQRSAKRWVPPSTDVSDLPELLRRSYRASRKAMKRAQTTERAKDFHEWRKTVKTLWYQLRLFERLVSGLTKQIEEFRELETALGEEHNLVVFRTRLTGDRELKSVGQRIEDVAAVSTALQGELRRTAVVLGERLFKLSPKEFRRDLERRLRPKGTPRRPPAPGTRGRAVA